MSNQEVVSPAARSTRVVIDAALPEEPVARLQKRIDLAVSIADPIVDDKSIVRPGRDFTSAQILLCTYPPANIEDSRSLQVIQLASSGYSQVQGLGLRAKGVRVCNARGVNDTAIAEWNIAMMICMARNFKQMICNQQKHVWDRAPVFQTEIRGATVGLWGYGGIGRQTARLCKSLAMKVHVLTRSGVRPLRNTYVIPESGDADGAMPDQVFTVADRIDFLHSLDFLILCLPLDRQTESIVAEAELRALPKSAFVLNPARGPLIKQSALLLALKEGWIAGAAIDTHYEYPLPPDHPLWAFDNVILTPHISGSSSSPFFKARLIDLFTQNIDRFLQDRPLLNELPPDRLVS